MRFTLEQVQETAERIRTSPDERPERLLALYGARDPNNLYYRLFHALSSLSGAAQVIEIGTYVGVSAAHLAINPLVQVLTIDCNPDAKRQAESLGFQNIKAITDDSVRYGKTLPKEPWIDLLFVDGNHTFNQAYGEYETFRPCMTQGGLIFFDDIRLPMATREMDVFWETVPDRKAELHGMHHTGIGVSVVDHAVKVRPWTEVIVDASRRFLPAR